MAEKTKFVCIECGYEAVKWLGKCPSCGRWNTFEEEVVETKKTKARGITSFDAPKKLSEIVSMSEKRVVTHLKELDRVLGGGLVTGEMVLVGGDPGIGKSTLLLQICEYLGKLQKILYASGEESLNQIKIRADRLKITTENLSLLSETSLDKIIEAAKDEKSGILIVDSIQTMFSEDGGSVPGSVSQVRECTHALMRFAKQSGTTVLIVGHVTKEGSIAGPKILEHMVDCVLYFEGERHQSYRILRTIKNRFGSTNEIGVFEMTDTGLAEVKNPSEMMISGRPENASGSVITCTFEGTRPILAEIQALSSPTGFGNARRMATGLDYNRAIMLVAILEKKLGYNMQNQDVYLNIAGGLKISEPATDLAAVMAIASNYKNFIVDYKTVILGEVGLTGEVRSITYPEKRVNEAKKLGFTRIILPYDNIKSVKNAGGTEIIGIKNVYQAIKYCRDNGKTAEIPN